MLQRFDLPKIRDTKFTYKPSNENFITIRININTDPIIFDQEIIEELKDLKLKSTIKQARLEYLNHDIVEEKEILKILA
jgi:hypothetical protein